MSENQDEAGSPAAKRHRPLWKKLQENLGFFASLIAIVTFVGGFIGWEAGSGKVEKRVEDVVAVSDQRLQEVILALPEQQRAALEPLIAAIRNLTHAPASGADREKAILDVEGAVGEIAKFSRLVTVKSYSAHSSPFTLPVGETLMLCDSQISVGLPRLTHNGARAMVVVSGKQLSLTPGKQVAAGGDSGKASVTLLDILGESNEAVFGFRCG